ncbi:MAG: hypothetical protein PHO74_00840 [Weeksellaceae bacterium]|nr:hypothetical protein [Weeksellaceae bacterium]
MKKFLFLGVVSMLILTSCAGSKVVVDNEKNMRGDWTITNVSFVGIDEAHVNAKVFDEADPKCYIGSDWHLVQNNNSGNYTMNGPGNCPGGTTNIKWFVSEEGGNVYFNFKRIYDGEKPKNVLDGYRLKITANDGSYMVMRQDISFEGKIIGINYSFSKN